MGIFDHLFGTEDPETDPEYFVPTDSIGLQTTTASSIWWTKSVTITSERTVIFFQPVSSMTSIQ